MHTLGLVTSSIATDLARNDQSFIGTASFARRMTVSPRMMPGDRRRCLPIAEQRAHERSVVAAFKTHDPAPVAR